MKASRLLAALLVCMSAVSVSAKVKLHPLFTDNMVLQQQSEVNIWGEASPNKNVTVVTSWNGATYTAKAGADGKWRAVIATPKAGGPYTITVSDGKKPEVLGNVLIGEVWVCSGQSNMEMKVGDRVTNMEEAMANAAKYKNIRLFHVQNTTSPSPKDVPVVRHGGWQESTAENIYDFSATAYFFGQHLTDSLDIPVGLIETCWGGTLAEAWTSAEGLQMMPYFHEKLAKVKTLPESREERDALFYKDLAVWTEEIKNYDKAFENGRLVWGAVDYDDSDWMDMKVPLFYQDQGLGNTSGYSWMRKTVEIPASWEGQELQICVGVVDDNEYTYFNGVQIGRTEGCLSLRRYTVPAELVKAGRAVVSVRVMDTGGKGGIVGNADDIALTNPAGEKIPLTGTWKFRMSVGFADSPDMPVNTAREANFPTFLYNAMINPLIDFKIAGAIWYQGEANVARADQYNELMPLMINDWRQKWGYDFPFYLVQLANFMLPQTGPEESEWAELRDAQFRTLNLENTGMAVIIDIGEAEDIHPKNKVEVGRRLALYALAKTYGQNIAYSGPLYDGYRLENGEVRISFTNTDNGLKAGVDGKAAKLTGFYIAGTDRVFHDAAVRIEGDTIVVSSDKVDFPVAVRYGWANNPACNLYNGAGLPASPFRTDNWE